MTPPGEMRHLVVYQKPVRSRDSLGQTRIEWVDQFAAYAAVRPLSARELYYASGTRSETTHRVAIRYRPGVEMDGRFKFGDRHFNISSILNTDELNAELVILAVEAN